MSNDSVSSERGYRRPTVIRQGGASEAVYGLGMIGAWIYFFTHAATFWIGVLGFFKGLVWPAFLVYEVFQALGL